MGQPGEVERVFVQCLPGLEGVLEIEAGSLGRVKRVAGGVELEGPPGVHAQAVLVLRVAERVLLRLIETPVRRWSDVERYLQSVTLEGLAAPGGRVMIELTVRTSGAPAGAVLPGRLARLWGRPVSRASGDDREGGVPRLVLRVAEGVAALSADVGGTLLHRRGWRQEVSRAPLRETLAAGVLVLSGHRTDRPVWDPVCGSGTLVIEAALVARGVAPGLGRSFAAERWPEAARVDWAGRRERLRAQVRAHARAPIVGTDLNAGALGTARRNARRAGVLEELRLERLDVSNVAPGLLTPGLIVGNLPYGLRVGVRHGLEVFDTSLATTLRGRFGTWRWALLVDDPDRLLRAGGRAPDQVHRLVNGGIPVVLGVWDPEGTPKVFDTFDPGV
ncbi:MAG TPA: RNA methyltransferase [Myxococcaceae bacterium]|nr:RNA methyltransferase [Myxococcaceae bacterium]